MKNHQRFPGMKKPRNHAVPGFFDDFDSRLTLGELGSSSCLLEAVLLKATAGFFIEFGLIQSVITASFVL